MSAEPGTDSAKLPPCLPRGLRNRTAEKEAREGRHPFSELSEASYRRGFEDGVDLVVNLAGENAADPALLKAAKKVAAVLRFEKRPIPDYREAAQREASRPPGEPRKGRGTPFNASRVRGFST